MLAIAPRTKALGRLLLFSLFLTTSPLVAAHPSPPVNEGAQDARKLVDAGLDKLHSEVKHGAKCALNPVDCTGAAVKSRVHQVEEEIHLAGDKVKAVANCARNPIACTKEKVINGYHNVESKLKSSALCLRHPQRCAEARYENTLQNFHNGMKNKENEWRADAARLGGGIPAQKRDVLVVDLGGDARGTDDDKLIVDSIQVSPCLFWPRKGGGWC